MPLNGKCIYIVEDNVMNRVVFQMALVTQGAHVEFDRWGKNAISHLKQLPHVDLIILDLMLYGGISGYDIFTEIRALPQFDAVPIVIVSASEPSVAIPKAKELGLSGFISKPIDEELFPKQIAAILEGEKIWYDGTTIRG